MSLKPKFDATINLGHVLVAVSFIAPAVVYGVRFSAEFALMKNQVHRHGVSIDTMSDTLRISQQNQAVVTRLLEDHLRQRHVLSPRKETP